MRPESDFDHEVGQLLHVINKMKMTQLSHKAGIRLLLNFLSCNYASGIEFKQITAILILR